MAYTEEDCHVEGLYGSIREQEDEGPTTMQEEMNDILEAFYSIVSEEDIYQYQKIVESVIKRKIAEDALDCPAKCPDFELEDQDGEFSQRFYRYVISDECIL